MNSLQVIFGEISSTATLSARTEDDAGLEQQEACRYAALQALAALRGPDPSFAVDDYTSGSNYSASGFYESRLFRSVTRLATRLLLTFDPVVPSMTQRRYEPSFACSTDGTRFLLFQLANAQQGEIPAPMIRTRRQIRILPPDWETERVDDEHLKVFMERGV
jgi:hypothetical protein